MVLHKLAKKWIAGLTLEDAVKRAKKANQKGIAALINVVGEHVKSHHEAERHAIEYLKAIKAIRNHKLHAGLSLKLTQLGLYISKHLCLDNMKKIVYHAKNCGIFVWIDMENSDYTEKTLDIYLSLLSEFSNVGITFQASLKRSKEDLFTVLEKRGKIRLVKGGYKESEKIAYTDKNQINKNFKEMMIFLFKKSSKFAIATHDRSLIAAAQELGKKYHKDFQFQMLMGVRNSLKTRLVEEGYNVAEYIPYGEKWVQYILRRIRENRRIHVTIKSLLLEKDI